MDPNNRSITPSNAGNITAAASSTSHHHHHQRPLAPLLPATLLDQQQQQQHHHHQQHQQQQQQQRIVNNLPQEWRSVPNYHHADPEGGPAFLPMPQVATLPPNTTGASGAAITTTTSINNPSASSSAAQKPIIAGVYPPHHNVNGATTPTTHEFYPYNSRYHPSNPTHARGHSPPPPASSLNIGGSPNRKQGMYEERLGDNGEMIRVQPFQPSQGAGNGAAPVYHGHVEDPTWEHQQFTKHRTNGGVVGVARDEVEIRKYSLGDRRLPTYPGAAAPAFEKGDYSVNYPRSRHSADGHTSIPYPDNSARYPQNRDTEVPVSDFAREVGGFNPKAGVGAAYPPYPLVNGGPQYRNGSGPYEEVVYKGNVAKEGPYPPSHGVAFRSGEHHPSHYHRGPPPHTQPQQQPYPAPNHHAYPPYYSHRTHPPPPEDYPAYANGYTEAYSHGYPRSNGGYHPGQQAYPKVPYEYQGRPLERERVSPPKPVNEGEGGRERRLSQSPSEQTRRPQRGLSQGGRMSLSPDPALASRENGHGRPSDYGNPPPTFYLYRAPISHESGPQSESSNYPFDDVRMQQHGPPRQYPYHQAPSSISSNQGRMGSPSSPQQPNRISPPQRTPPIPDHQQQQHPDPLLNNPAAAAAAAAAIQYLSSLPLVDGKPITTPTTTFPQDQVTAIAVAAATAAAAALAGRLPTPITNGGKLPISPAPPNLASVVATAAAAAAAAAVTNTTNTPPALPLKKKPEEPKKNPAQTDAGNSDKRFQCHFCQKRFSRPSSLTTHVYTHTGERPHACTMPGCGRSFSVLSNLRRHLRVCQRNLSRRGVAGTSASSSAVAKNDTTKSDLTKPMSTDQRQLDSPLSQPPVRAAAVAAASAISASVDADRQDASPPPPRKRRPRSSPSSSSSSVVHDDEEDDETFMMAEEEEQDLEERRARRDARNRNEEDVEEGYRTEDDDNSSLGSNGSLGVDGGGDAKMAAARRKEALGRRRQQAAPVQPVQRASSLSSSSVKSLTPSGSKAVKRRAPASPAVDAAECSDDMAVVLRNHHVHHHVSQIPRKRRNTAPAAAPPATVGGESPIGDTTSTDSPRVPNPADDDTATMMMMMDVQETGSTGSRGSRGSRGSGSGSGSGDSGRRSGSSSGGHASKSSGSSARVVGESPESFCEKVGSASGGSSDGCEEVQVKRRKVEGVVGVMHTGCEGVESGGKPTTAGEDEIEVEEEAQAIQVPA